MNEQLQAKIDEYQESLQSLREEGQVLEARLISEGWEVVESLLDLGYVRCCIHPKLWADLNNDEGIAYDNEDGFHYLQCDLTNEEWEMIVELPVTG